MICPATAQFVFRYPVKSMLGEQLSAVDIDANGLYADRRFAVVTEAGKTASGKTFAGHQQVDGLLNLRAIMQEEKASIVFPSGSVVECDAQQVHSALSEYLERKARLVKRQRPFFDDSPLHLLTTASLARLAKQYSGTVANTGFRANLILDTPLEDSQLSGAVVQLGEVKLRITHRTERCRMIAVDNVQLLSTVVSHFDQCFGVYARVLSAGRLMRGQQGVIETV